MAEHTQSPEGPSAGTASPRGPARRWWTAAIAFVAGVVVGGVAVGLVSGGTTTAPGAAPGTSSAPSARPGGSAGTNRSPTVGATAQIMVNEACLRAINAAQDVYRNVGDLAQAASQLNAAQLDAVIQRLEPLQTRLQDAVTACHVTSRLPNGSGITGTPPASPGDSPSS